MRKKTILLVTLSILAILIIGFILCIRFQLQLSKESYAQWGVAEMIIEYHKENGVFPTSWDDLESYDSGITTVVPFDETKEMLIIEFDRLSELESVSPDDPHHPEIIYLKNGRQCQYPTREPNQLIVRYLTEREAKESTLKDSPNE